MANNTQRNAINRLLITISNDKEKYLLATANGLSEKVLVDQLQALYFSAVDKVFTNSKAINVPKSSILAGMMDGIPKSSPQMLGLIPVFLDDIHTSPTLGSDDEVLWALGHAKESAASFRLSESLADISTKSCNGDISSSEALGEISKVQLEISSLSNTKSKVTTLLESKDDIIRSLTSKDDPPATTGFRSLDRVLFGGFQNSYLCYVCGRPGMCKTQALVNMAIRAADSGKKPLIMTYELPAPFIVKRCLAYKTNMPLAKLIGGANSQDPVTDDEIEDLKIQYAMLQDNIRICSSSGMNVIESASLIKNEIAVNGVDIVFLDYVQIIRTPDGKVPEREADFASISFVLRELAASENIPVIAAAQLNREVEKRKNKRPMLSDLRSSGSFENDARVVLGLYRDEYYNPHTDDQNILEISVLKNTNGELITTKNFFNKQKCQIFELEEATGEIGSASLDDRGVSASEESYDDRMDFSDDGGTI